MAIPDQVKVILKKLVAGTATDKDIEALDQACEGSEQIKVQIAKYINNVNQAQDSQFGDHLCQNADTEAIQRAKLDKNKPSVDELVQQVRSRFHDDIQRLHDKTPLLGVDHWVDLGELFVDVNILKELSSSRKSELDDLWQDFSAGVQNYSSYLSLDRIGLGLHQQRVSGLTVLAKNTNLMVVGKPGSGKTTYLQRIVTECNQGKLQPHRIPVLIKLREFVDDGRSFEYNLERYLTQQWRLSEPKTELVLSQGKALILLDGLDEVTGEDGQAITKQIKLFARTYPQNQLIVTCRIQSQESRFERFDYVEVADFNKAQVNAFAEHWFKAVCSNPKEGKAKARQFLNKLSLEENKPIRELAITPILLSLTCAVFQAQGKFYSKRSKLYEEGLELLLQKWDKSREIERDEIYRDLSPERKQELLSYLAVKKFEQPQYVLFEQEEIEKYIAKFLGISRRDSRVVLRAIEAQHGLLIERAQKVWSFSHLTFQEYLVARQMLVKCNPLSIDDPILNELVSHVTDKRWREVFLLAVVMLDTPDALFWLMKVQIDKLLLGNERLQKFLIWVNQKSQSVDVSYIPAAIRAFYLNNCEVTLSQEIDNTIFEYRDGVPVPFLSLEGDIYIDYNLQKTLSSSYLLNQDIQEDPEGHPDYNQALYYDSDNLFSASLLCGETSPQNFKTLIGELNRHNPHSQWEEFKQWWQANGQVWTEKLKVFMTEHRNIGNDWQFSKEQQKLIRQYSDANKLLVNCLNSNCNISLQVREEIEETLLLPIAEIEKRNRER